MAGDSSGDVIGDVLHDRNDHHQRLTKSRTMVLTKQQEDAELPNRVARRGYTEHPGLFEGGRGGPICASSLRDEELNTRHSAALSGQSSHPIKNGKLKPTTVQKAMIGLPILMIGQTKKGYKKPEEAGNRK